MKLDIMFYGWVSESCNIVTVGRLFNSKPLKVTVVKKASFSLDTLKKKECSDNVSLKIKIPMYLDFNDQPFSFIDQ